MSLLEHINYLVQALAKADVEQFSWGSFLGSGLAKVSWGRASLKRYSSRVGWPESALSEG
jgi:hypothetical protein